jgi:hypothetical protein
MATGRPDAVPGDLPRLLTSGFAVLMLLFSTAAPVGATPHPGPNRGVRAGGDGYTPWANTPASGRTSGDGIQSPTTQGTSASTGNAPCRANGMNACVVRCNDPRGTGICNGPAPAITPAQLARQSWNSLHLPLPDVQTAPPRGTQGLVGLPEWVWVPRDQWRPLSKQATAGGVWAQVTAAPKQMTITPGAGLPPVPCAGPGTAYDPDRPASAQQTDCSYTYRESSALQPGAVYRVTVTVVWGGVWTGSGGAGGTLPDISRSTTFALAVAEGQGLYG